MAGKIVIDIERCKGCGLCVVACPNQIIVISKKSNKNGYFPASPRQRPAEAAGEECTGCAMCAMVCPEVIIEVYRDDNTDDESRKKSGPSLVKEKA